MSQKLIKAMLLSCLLMVFVTSALAAPLTQGTTCEKDYVVQADDTLSKLADKFYGDMLAYPAIFDATNAAAAKGGAYKPIANPDLIEVGQTLCMPPAADIKALLGATKVAVGKTGGVINMTPARFFPEGTTVDKNGNFYMGSMYEGSIYKAAAGAKEAEPFIEAGENGLVSVLGLYADDATNTLWACSSDAGNGKLTGSAPVAVKAFDMQTGAAKGSYDFPGGGFCNDLTVDAVGNVYASDSWSPRVLRLPVGGTALEEWVKDPVLGVEQWSLNGLDVDQSKNEMYIVNQAKGQLFRIPIGADGKAGVVTEIKTSKPLRRPDGLKVVAPNILATGEGGSGGMAMLKLNGDTAQVTVISEGLDGVATFALYQGSAWLVENQGDHFWGPDTAGPDATPPFRLVEVPLNITGGGGVINMTPARFFPEGTTVDKNGNFYMGSMYEGSIYKAAAGAKEAEPFIEAGENGLVSVLGLYADDATNTLWACSSDAGNGKLTGSAPVAVKAFDMQTGAAKGSYDFPGGGFCNDLTVDAVGNVYASDSWSPRVLRLPVGGTALEEWVKDPVLGVEQWSLNGLDVDQSKNEMYIVNQAKGQLFRIPIGADGKAGVVTEIKTSKPLRRPDGLKVVAPNILATAEGGAGGMAILTLDGDKAAVKVVNTGLNGIATFALYQGSAWLVENQADHFWGPDSAGPDAQPPFRLVEVPLN